MAAVRAEDIRSTLTRRCYRGLHGETVRDRTFEAGDVHRLGTLIRTNGLAILLHQDRIKQRQAGGGQAEGPSQQTRLIGECGGAAVHAAARLQRAFIASRAGIRQPA